MAAKVHIRTVIWGFGVMTLVARGAPQLEFSTLRRAGWVAAYQTDYETAKAKFVELQKAYPKHPSGDLSMASTIWQEYLYKTRRLRSNLYNKDSKFYEGGSKGKDGREGDAIDVQVDAAFQRYLGQAMSKAEAMVESSPKDPEGIYQLGAVYGIRAAYEASAQRRFWAAFRDGMKSVKLHKQVVELDAQFYDAYLTLGLYHYAVGSMPFGFRMIASMAGITGSKKKGIEELELAMQKGRYNADDARALLVALYRYEQNPQQALSLLEGYTARYPRNIPLRIELASTLVQLKRSREAREKFEELLKTEDRRLMDLVHFEYGEALAKENDWAAAATQFGEAAKSEGAAAEMIAMLRLRAGNMYDMAKQRDAALQSYRECLATGGSATFRKGVEKYLRAPYEGT